MSDSGPVHGVASVVIGLASILFAGLAVFGLLYSAADSTPGVAVSALVLLAGSAYGLVASIVGLVRGRRRPDVEPDDESLSAEPEGPQPIDR